MDLHIRAATENDAAATAALINPIIDARVYTIMTERATAESQRAWMRSVAGVGAINVAICNNTQRLLGIQSVEPHSRSLDVVKHVCDISTFVALDALRRGIGAALTRETLRSAKALGYRNVLAMIRADNPHALAFYQSQGFTIAGTLRQHARVRNMFVDEVLAERFVG